MALNYENYKKGRILKVQSSKVKAQNFNLNLKALLILIFDF